MHFPFFALIFLLITSCQFDSNQPKKSKNDTIPQADETLRLQRNVINQYYFEEKAVLDSINKYQLDSIYNRCLKLLYGIYGTEKITDLTRNESTSIGECDIRLYKFKYKSSHLRRIDFEVFWSDSLPVNADFTFASIGGMNTSFTVDIYKKRILNGSDADVVIEPIRSLEILYGDIVSRKKFSDYIRENKSRLSPKFRRLFSDY